MSEELQKQLAEMLKSLMATAQDATTWAKGEIPLLVKEKIMLGRVEETVYFVVSLLVGAVILYYSLKLWKHSWQLTKEDADEPVILANIIGVILSVVVIYPSHNFFTVWFAPRLYIIEWLTSLVKK